MNNTGASPIIGSFSSLPEGALVNVLFGGSTYHFLISYLGGDGNDITLTLPQPAPTSPQFKGSTGFRRANAQKARR